MTDLQIVDKMYLPIIMSFYNALCTKYSKVIDIQLVFNGLC